jgi:hypothetical protein
MRLTLIYTNNNNTFFHRLAHECIFDLLRARQTVLLVSRLYSSSYISSASACVPFHTHK